METRTVGRIQTGTMTHPRSIRFDRQDVNILGTKFRRQILAGSCCEIVYVENYSFARHGARSSISIASMINVHGGWINGLENASKSPDYFSSLYSFNMNCFYIYLTLQFTVKDEFFSMEIIILTLTKYLRPICTLSYYQRCVSHLQGSCDPSPCRYKIEDSLLQCAVIDSKNNYF